MEFINIPGEAFFFLLKMYNWVWWLKPVILDDGK
jgi:hypothetical protein